MSRRVCFAALVLAVFTSLAGATSANAVSIARVGDQIVIRPDFDEILRDVVVTTNGDSFTIAKRVVVDDIGTPHSGPGCDPTGAPTCQIAGATSLKLELGEGDQEATVTDSPIPVIFDGGTGRDRPTITGAPSTTIIGGTGDDIARVTGGTITMDGGDGDDTLEATDGTATVTGGEGDDTIRGATTADGGNGDDTLESTVEDAKLTGGAGNDTFFTASPRDPTRQTLDCGAGSDTADVDGQDDLGSGCGPAFTNLRPVGTLARITKDGGIQVTNVAKVTKSVSARVSVSGPHLLGLPKSFKGAYATSSIRLAGGAKVTSKLKPSSSKVRSVLAKRKAAVTNATVRIELYAPGKTTGDSTIVNLPGTLRPM